MIADLAIPALLGALRGASVHRAGLCTVKAVAEVMTSGRAHLLWSFLKASFWTLGLLSIAMLADAEPSLASRPLMLSGIGGGLLFGMAAGINGACSASTLSRLAEGHGVMLLTLAGWGGGLLAMKGLLAPDHGAAVAALLPFWMILPGLGWIGW